MLFINIHGDINEDLSKQGAESRKNGYKVH